MVNERKRKLSQSDERIGKTGAMEKFIKKERKEKEVSSGENDLQKKGKGRKRAVKGEERERKRK